MKFEIKKLDFGQTDKLDLLHGRNSKEIAFNFSNCQITIAFLNGKQLAKKVLALLTSPLVPVENARAT